MAAVDAASPARGGLGRLGRRLDGAGQVLVVLAAIVALFVVVSFVNPRFMSAANLTTIFSGNAYIAVAAIGMTMVIITGNIDVSVGALIGVLATITGTLAVAGWPLWMVWLAPLLVGMAINTAAGLLVAYGRIPSIVLTLGLLSILRGGLIVATGGAWITDLPPGFFLAQQRIFGLPVPFVTAVVLAVAVAWWMSSFRFGRAIYAVGSNPEAARAIGISVERTIVGVFALHGMFAGIAAVLFATQLTIIQSTVPPNLELTIITACVIGGVSILGGVGTVIGAALATVLFATITAAMIFTNVSAYWLRAVIGALILITVLADVARRRGRT
jgi:ribose/xylose/arabinose/galactoside ABC-type transport system permease subunit